MCHILFLLNKTYFAQQYEYIKCQKHVGQVGLSCGGASNLQRLWRILHLNLQLCSIIVIVYYIKIPSLLPSFPFVQS